MKIVAIVATVIALGAIGLLIYVLGGINRSLRDWFGY